jgi:hypothetical protein
LKEICSLNLTGICQQLGQLWRQKLSSNQQLLLGFCGDGNLKLKLKEHCKQAQQVASRHSVSQLHGKENREIGVEPSQLLRRRNLTYYQIGK